MDPRAANFIMNIVKIHGFRFSMKQYFWRAVLRAVIILYFIFMVLKKLSITVLSGFLVMSSLLASPVYARGSQDKSDRGLRLGEVLSKDRGLKLGVKFHEEGKGGLKLGKREHSDDRRDEDRDQQQVDSACAKSTVSKREDAIIVSLDLYAASLKAALQARKDVIVKAYDVTDPELRNDQIEDAQDTFEKAQKDAEKVWNRARKEAQKKFRKEFEKCWVSTTPTTPASSSSGSGSTGTNTSASANTTINSSTTTGSSTTSAGSSTGGSASTSTSGTSGQ